MEIRVCTKCGEEKPATSEFFYKHKTGYLGLRADCKVCVRAHSKRYREQNPEKVAECKKRYHEKHREKHNANSKRWRKEHPEKVAEYQKRRNEEKKEARDEYNKRYYKEHREAIVENKKRRRENEPAAIYEIKNKETGKIYIGATTAFPKRCSTHKSHLRRGIHANQALQEDYNKYGLDVFEFEVIEEHPCDTDFKILEKIEEETIKRLLTEGKELYNTILYSTR